MTIRTLFAHHSRTTNSLSFFLALLLLLPSLTVLAQPLQHTEKLVDPDISSTLHIPSKLSDKPVDPLKVGEIIHVRNNATGKVEWKQVIHASKRTVASLLSVQLTDNRTGHSAASLTCPIDESVKLTSGKFIPAGRLAIGNSIITRAGPVCKVKALFLLRKQGGFVLCDVRVGPLSVANARLLALSQAGQARTNIRFADYKVPVSAESYAVPASTDSGTVNPFLFNGQQYDPASSTYYLRARYYDPTAGRFLSPDLYAGNPYNPATLHKYSYTSNDPVNYADPTGREGELASIGAATTVASTIVAQEEPAIVNSLEDAQGVAGEVADAASGTAETLLRRATDILVKRWNPFTGSGPLGKLPNAQEIIKSFRGGSYSEILTTETTTLYRVYPTGGNVLGSYWTRIPPSGPLQSQFDLALLPEWGNTAENVATIEVPSGTTLYEGFAEAQQGTINLPGGGSQIFIPTVDSSWLIN